jgi:uncharacterized protein (DUF2141 family)
MAQKRWAFWTRGLGGLIVGLFLAVAAPSTTANAEGRPGRGTESIELVIKPLRSNLGNVFVAVYERPGWLVPGKFRTYRTVPAHQGGLSVRVNGLSRGWVAVAVFHDENKNGRVDKNWLGLPAEGFGFSRLTPMRVPSFDEVSFPAGTANAMEVRMRY